MIRVTTLRQTGNAPPATGPAAGIAAAITPMNEFVAAARKVQGAGNVRWFFGDGGVVIIGEPESYAVADKILADQVVQAAGAKVFALGFAIAEDRFLLEPERAMPFLAQR